MTVQSKAVLDLSFTAEQDLSEKQYHFMELSGNWQVDTCDAATDKAIGVLQNKPTSLQAADVRILGVSLVVADGSGTNITAGSFVGPNSGGTAVAKGTANSIVAGIALAGATTSGAVIPVLLTPVNVFGTASLG